MSLLDSTLRPIFFSFSSFNLKVNWNTQRSDDLKIAVYMTLRPPVHVNITTAHVLTSIWFLSSFYTFSFINLKVNWNTQMSNGLRIAVYMTPRPPIQVNMSLPPTCSLPFFYSFYTFSFLDLKVKWNIQMIDDLRIPVYMTLRPPIHVNVANSHALISLSVFNFFHLSLFPLFPP